MCKFILTVLFTLFCWGIGGIMIFQTTGETALFFMSGVGLTFTGAATMFKSTEANTNKFHFIGALICIVAALIGLGVEYDMYIPGMAFIFGSIFTYLFIMKNTFWWIEIIAFTSIGIGLLFK